MSMLFSRTAVIPVWLVVLALFALSRWPMPFAWAVLLLIVGVAVPVIMLTSWKDDAFGRIEPLMPPREDSHD